MSSKNKMMTTEQDSAEIAIQIEGLGKCYQIYDKPHDRLLQMLWRGHKRFYREFWALRDVSFTVRKGETVGIIGRNGSGKSTLLQMICGTLNPTLGGITVNGKVAALLELGAGFNPEFTGRENVYMAASLYGLNREKVDKRFDQIAAFADIGDHLDQPVKTYSSGMYVRLAFAVIAHVDADILVIDEALAVGDALFTQKCMRFIRKFREEHSLLFVSHDTPSVINLCDRAVWLNKGKIQETGPSKPVCESYLNSLLQTLEIDTAKKENSEQQPGLQIKRIGQEKLQWRDQRTDLINSSNLRNDLEVFKFKEDGECYGGEEARVINVALIDTLGHPLRWVVGGEKVCLRVVIDTYIALKNPILGFSIKDRLGQSLFGDNTYLSFSNHDCASEAGQQLVGEFEFFMPWLTQGDYTVQVAVAEGTQISHRQLHWLHDALVFRSHHNSLSTGLIGIPMTEIRLYKS